MRGEDARAAHLEGKQSGRLERTVTDEFRVEPEAAAAGKQEIFFILLGELARDDGGLAVRGAGDDEAVEFLHGPTGLDEIDGEPIEQLGVRGRLALVAEVFEQAHKAVPEEGLPLTIDRDAGGERVLRGEEPAGEGQSVGWSVLGKGRKECWDGGRDFLLGAEVFAAVVEEGRTRVGSGTFAHHERGLAARNLFT